jgi:hypothetical protein
MSFRMLKENLVGPLDVFSLCGEFVIVDRGAGNRVLAPRFKTRDDAHRWMLRQELSQ